MPERALIVASGLRGITGHNFSYTEAVRQALEMRGWSVTVFAHRALAPELAVKCGYQPVFSIGTYDLPPGKGPWRDLLYLYRQSRIYANELQHALTATENDFDLVFCHTLADFELIGWRRLLGRQRLPGSLLILQRNTPRFRLAPRWKLVAHPYWRIKPHCLNALRRRMAGRFVLLTDSETLSEDYARIYRHRIVTLPLPLNSLPPADPKSEGPFSADFAARYRLTGGESITFGYLGDARASKGFQLLPETLHQVLRQPACRARFVIQCVANEYDAKEPEGLARLRQLQQEFGPRLTLVTDKLSESDYARLLQFLDVVLLPYVDRNFVEGTSNIFAEALAMGKPVVVTAGTWMARELRKSGGGMECELGSAADLAAKCLALANRYDEYAQRAQQFSPVWRQLHNSGNLADILLYEAARANPRLQTA